MGPWVQPAGLNLTSHPSQFQIRCCKSVQDRRTGLYVSSDWVSMPPQPPVTLHDCFRHFNGDRRTRCDPISAPGSLVTWFTVLHDTDGRATPAECLCVGYGHSTPDVKRYTDLPGPAAGADQALSKLPGSRGKGQSPGRGREHKAPAPRSPRRNVSEVSAPLESPHRLLAAGTFHSPSTDRGFKFATARSDIFRASAPTDIA